MNTSQITRHSTSKRSRVVAEIAMHMLLLITENARCQCDSVAAIFDFVPGRPYFEALAYRFFCLANHAHLAAFEFPGPRLRYSQVDRSQRSARPLTIRPMNLVVE